MNFEYLLFNARNILKQLSAEDFFLLAIIFIFVIDRKCDRTFMLMLALIFLKEVKLQPLLNMAGFGYNGGPFRHF